MLRLLEMLHQFFCKHASQMLKTDPKEKRLYTECLVALIQHTPLPGKMETCLRSSPHMTAALTLRRTSMLTLSSNSQKRSGGPDGRLASGPFLLSKESQMKERIERAGRQYDAVSQLWLLATPGSPLRKWCAGQMLESLRILWRGGRA